MVEYTGPTQNIRPGGVILFTEATVIGNTPVVHRDGSGTFTLPSLGCPYSSPGYKCTFGGNITFPAEATPEGAAATAPLSLAIAVAGEPDTTTEMLASPAAGGTFVNVGRTTAVNTVGGCCATIGVENTSNGVITVQNPSLIIDVEGV